MKTLFNKSTHQLTKTEEECQQKKITLETKQIKTIIVIKIEERPTKLKRKG